MCQNIFKNQEEKKRKDEFNRLFAALVTSSMKQTGKAIKNDTYRVIGG